MARNSGDGLELLFGIIFVGILIAIFFIKWIIIAGILLIALSIWFVTAIAKYVEKKQAKQTAKNAYVTKKVLRGANSSDTLTKYDNMFDFKIRARGIEYFNNKKIEILEDNKLNTKAIVYGTTPYDVDIYYDEAEEITKASCTCPYFVDNGQKCKHIYGVILKKIYKDKLPEKEEEIIEKIYDYNLEEELQKIDKKYETKQEDISSDFEDDIDDVEDVEDDEDKLNTALGVYAIFDTIEKNNKQNKEKERIAKENKMYKEKYGLTNEEIEHVRKDGYDPWQFEEEDMDEEDYYSEDD